MKKTKRLYILLGVLAILCLLIFIVSRYEEKKEKIKNSEDVILEINKDDVRSLSWKNETTELSFHKDENWIYDKDEAFPVDEDKVAELLEWFETFETSFVIEDVEDYGQYGLDNPLCEIQLETTDKIYKMALGDYSSMDSKRYVSIDDGNVYLAFEDPLEDFNLELNDMLLKDEIPSLEEVRKITFAGAESYEVVYEKDSKHTYCKEDVYFKKDGENMSPLDTLQVEAYLDTIRELNLGEVMTYHATEEELKKYGLSEPKLTVKLEYEEKEEKSGEFVLQIAGAEESEDVTAYARIGKSKIIYQISKEAYEELMKAGYDNLRHQKVMTAAFEDMTKIDVTLEGKDYTLTAKEEKDETVWYLKDKKIDEEDLRTALAGLEVTEFTDKKPKEKEEIRLTVHLDNENYPEVSLELYRYDGSKCLAVLDGEPVALVNREDVVELVEAVNGIVLE